MVPFWTSRTFPDLGLSEDYDYRDQRSEAPCRSSLSWASLYRDVQPILVLSAPVLWPRSDYRECNWRASDTRLSRSPKTTRRYSGNVSLGVQGLLKSPVGPDTGSRSACGACGAMESVSDRRRISKAGGDVPQDVTNEFSARHNGHMSVGRILLPPKLPFDTPMHWFNCAGRGRNLYRAVSQNGRVPW